MDSSNIKTMHDVLHQLKVEASNYDKNKTSGSKTGRSDDVLSELLVKVLLPPRSKRRRFDAERSVKEEEKGEEMEEESIDGIKYYAKMLQECRRDEEQQKQHHETSMRKIREIRSVYLYGLSKVSTLQNLRDAPDAILPGNFPQGNIQRVDPSSIAAPSK